MSNYITELQERENRKEAVTQRIIQHLTTDKAIQEYFKQFSTNSIEPFISGYAGIISQVEEYTGVYERIGEAINTEHIDRAQDCLKEIQLKKLFNQRCEWGANLISIPGIEFSFDFYPWSNNVLNCPFVAPISAEEFDLYMQYAASEDFTDEKDYYWSSFERARDMEDDTNFDKDRYPEWFLYYDTYTVGANYAGMPDLRGEKEDFYRRLSQGEKQKELNRKYESGEAQRPETDDRPDIDSRSRNHVEDFMNRFESARIKRLFENYEKYGRPVTFAEEKDESHHLDERVDDIITALGRMKEVCLPVEANKDWRKALIKAWDQFKRKQLLDYLPDAYADYLFRIEQKIQFPEGEQTWQKDIVTIVRQQIIEGREINDEPGDLDF